MMITFIPLNYSTIGDGNQSSGYLFEGIGFFAFDTNVSGTVPVYGFLNSSSWDHFYSTSSSTPSGYSAEGIRFYAYTSSVNGAVPVYRYYDSATGDHFYTKNPDEFMYASTGHAYEGIAFYAH